MAPSLGELRKLLEPHGQAHVLDSWDHLSGEEKEALARQLQRIDLQLLRELYHQKDKTFSLPAAERIAPIPWPRADECHGDAMEAGAAAWRRGEVAALMVAGGQGTRLGFDRPKGMFPIGPVSNMSLFQVHAEKILALSRKYRRDVPFVIMTSPATHAETLAFFHEHTYFGLPPDDVHVFCQGTMPALDLASGKLILEGPGRLFESPNGHGGVLAGLAESGLLQLLRERGIRHIFYFQVDNPLVRLADRAFLGRHVLAEADVSIKVVPKESPEDKLGNLVLVDGRLGMIEYSDITPEMAAARAADGSLHFWAGSPAIHIFSVAFLSSLAGSKHSLPYHLARKKVPYFDSAGRIVQPDTENALKFEMFIFDVLPRAERWTVAVTSRKEEFVPLKNASGPDSPSVVRQALCDLAGDWLEACGVAVPRDHAGAVAVPLEISSLLALDAEELRDRLKGHLTVNGPLYLR